MEIINTIILITVLLLLIKRTDWGIKSQKNVWVIDSCTLIDGRILEIVRLGFFKSQIVVPEVVVNELQLLADGSDSYKRARARFGLDVLSEIKDIKGIDVKITKSPNTKNQPVDDVLIGQSKKMRAKLVTLDYNLIKVAKVTGVESLNINDLAQKLRPVILPGERVKVKIVQKGSNKDQGVGYLEDGTMVVVDNASRLINKTVNVEVNRYLQTEAGKMIFASKSSN